MRQERYNGGSLTRRVAPYLTPTQHSYAWTHKVSEQIYPGWVVVVLCTHACAAEKRLNGGGDSNGAKQ